jgi:hypothetical protein
LRNESRAEATGVIFTLEPGGAETKEGAPPAFGRLQDKTFVGHQLTKPTLEPNPLRPRLVCRIEGSELDETRSDRNRGGINFVQAFNILRGNGGDFWRSFGRRWPQPWPWRDGDCPFWRRFGGKVLEHWSFDGVRRRHFPGNGQVLGGAKVFGRKTKSLGDGSVNG